MVVADRQVWVLGEPRISDDTNQIWVLGEAWLVLNSVTVGGVALTKSLSDTVTIADTIIKAFGANKADTFAIADSFTRVVAWIRAYPDTLTIADTLSKDISIAKAETLTIADVIVKAVGIAKAETVTITDSIVKAIGVAKADTLTILDTIVAALAVEHILNLFDTVTITDSISKAVSIAKSDTVTITESVVATIGKYCRLGVSRMDTARLTVSWMAVDRWKVSRVCKIIRRLL